MNNNNTNNYNPFLNTYYEELIRFQAQINNSIVENIYVKKNDSKTKVYKNTKRGGRRRG
ncbi:MAG TPA: hypothetical protein IAB45_05225 [Candidatus Onthousia faecavium]|nr:hypothetical protein [Candidatus Onthousia faecavium]